MSDEVGYGRPPKHSRFIKGKSGNPRGRPKKDRSARARSERELLEEIGNELVEVNGKSMTLKELAMRALFTKAAKGDVAAQRMLDRKIERAGLDKPERPSGVLLLPSPVPLGEWEASVAAQQAQYRNPDLAHKSDEELF